MGRGDEKVLVLNIKYIGGRGESAGVLIMMSPHPTETDFMP